MKKMHIFEILRVLGVLEVRQPTYLQGSKASKVLKELFSEQKSEASRQKAQVRLHKPEVGDREPEVGKQRSRDRRLFRNGPPIQSFCLLNPVSCLLPSVSCLLPFMVPTKVRHTHMPS